ncbi:MAG: hypothetical protein R6U66_06385 [Bacteroidales bacterium]|jgi:hypothetical protein
MRIALFGAEYLNIVELNTTGDNDNYIKGDSESKYLESEVFNLFAHCFEEANKLYEFFGATKYNARKIVPLHNTLKKKLEALEHITTIEEFDAHLGQIFLGEEFLDELRREDPNWRKDWEKYLDQLKQVNQGMIDLTQKCIEEQSVLWVIGY